MNTEHELKKIAEETSLSHKEKGESFSVIENFMKKHPVSSSPRLSPYASHWAFFRHAGVAFAAFILIAGTSTSFSAESTLPGDALYPVKINFNEKVIEKLAWGDEAKARAHISLSERRIDEIEKIAKEQETDPQDLATAVNSLIEHNEKAFASIAAASEEGNTESSKDLLEEFENVLDSYDAATSTDENLLHVESIIEIHKELIDDIEAENEEQAATSTGENL